MNGIADIAEKIGQLAVTNTKVMEFGVTNYAEDGPGTIGLWSERVNVRYKGDGVRQDLYVRGGSEQAYSTGGGDGTIVTMVAFSASFSGVSYTYVLRHTASSLFLDNLSTTTTTEFSGLGFSASVKLQHLVHGRFLYLFDTGGPSAGSGTDQAYYIDLKTLTAHKWLAAEPTNVLSFSWIDTGDFTEANIWGFREHASVYVYMSSFAWGADEFATTITDGTIEPGVYKYTYASGEYLIIDGVDHKRDTLLVITERTTVTKGGSTTAPTLQRRSAGYDVPLVNGLPDFSPQITKISDVYDVGGAQILFVDGPWQNIDRGGQITPGNSTNNIFTVIPSGIDIRPILESTGKYVVSDDDIALDSNYADPMLYRAYCIAYELDDGSFTVPGAPSVLSVDASSMFNASHELQKRGVAISLNTAASKVPSNAVKGWLFSTRWQLSERACFGTSEQYSNGPFFVNQSFSIDEDTVEDFTDDGALLTEMGSMIPHVDGKPVIITAGGLVPHHISGINNTLLIGGYTLQRQVPEVGKSFNTNKNTMLRTIGPTTTSLYLHIQYEYSDKTLSLPVGLYEDAAEMEFGSGAESTYQQRTPSAQVQAVWLYIEDRAGAQSYLFKKLTDADPEFYGAPLTVPNSIAGLDAVTIPAGSADNETIVLENYIAWGSPPQMIDIASQQLLSNVQRIERIFSDLLDSRRGDILRYLVQVLTNAEPVLVYLSVSGTDSGLTYTANEEVVSSSKPLKGTFACTPWNGRLLYQSFDGLYVWDVNRVEKFMDVSRYDLLGGTIQDSAYHSREHELWLMGDNNQVLVLGTPPLATNEVFATVFDYDFVGGLDMEALTSIQNALYGGFATAVIELDKASLFADNDVGPSAYAIAGTLESDYLGSSFDYIYLDKLEVLGNGIDVTLAWDDEGSRFPESVAAWTSDFDVAGSFGAVTVTMRGVYIPIHTRAIQPRLRLTITPTTNQRMAAARLYFRVLVHEGV